MCHKCECAGAGIAAFLLGALVGAAKLRGFCVFKHYYSVKHIPPVLPPDRQVLLVL